MTSTFVNFLIVWIAVSNFMIIAGLIQINESIKAGRR